MPSIEDWAAKAARKIRSEHRGCKEGPTQERCAAIIATFTEPILKLLAESRREHHHQELDEIFGCCPRCDCKSWAAVARAQDAGELDAEPKPNSDGPCTCGADEWNARVDEALR